MSIYKSNRLKNSIYFLLVVISMIVLVTACGGDSSKSDTSNQTETLKTNPSGLSDWELENGFGPVKKKLNLGPLDLTMAKEGEKIFESKCATCHKLDERYTGPAQRDVLQRITPEFFMNTVLNPDENLEKHPHGKKMLAEYMTKMTNQNINLKDARALLEYFRVLDEELKNQNKSN
ncbi:MAG TPA: c-type cytochrome [Ignavibacteriaceae bacterium]|nr:c-type cytochrome [Ignavibacteriaceae bacterium]